MFRQLGLIGCGLMGGSFALAMKQARLVNTVVGYSKSPSTTLRAKDLGVIDVEAKSALQAASGSDLILLAVPVSATADKLKEIREFVRPDTLVMDVGSTKGDVVKAAEKSLGASSRFFVPAHPVAGKEVSGVQHADPFLYQGARVILTPQDFTDTQKLEQATMLWQRLGARVTQMPAKEHDMMMAAVSHLPHLLSFAYMNSLLSQSEAQRMLSFAGMGFKDFSRIAASDPTVWRDILLANRTEVMGQLRQMVLSLQDLQQALHRKNGAELERLIGQASQARAEWKPSRD